MHLVRSCDEQAVNLMPLPSTVAVVAAVVAVVIVVIAATVVAVRCASISLQAQRHDRARHVGDQPQALGEPAFEVSFANAVPRAVRVPAERKSAACFRRMELFGAHGNFKISAQLGRPGN